MSVFKENIDEMHDRLGVSLFNLQSNPYFETFIEAIQVEREAFIRHAYNPETGDNDRLMCLGAVNLVDVINSIVEHGAQYKKPEKDSIDE